LFPKTFGLLSIQIWYILNSLASKKTTFFTDTFRDSFSQGLQRISKLTNTLLLLVPPRSRKRLGFFVKFIPGSLITQLVVLPQVGLKWKHQNRASSKGAISFLSLRVDTSP